jgi:hypothetical protein
MFARTGETTMTKLDITLPDSIAEAARAHAQRDSISMDYFVSLAVAEKIASINSWEQTTGQVLSAVELSELRGLLDRTGNNPSRAGDERRS